MWIYKITNTKNGKVYIGQTIRPITQRFHRHINDAINNILDTHLARAIRKHGKENFIIEEIDSAKTQEELDKKEQYWIRYYNSIKEGYNETEAFSKKGGNTYFSKTKEEMDFIREKIKNTKIGKKNPMARKVKRINILTQEEEVFDTIISCARACGIKNGKSSITTRLNKTQTKPFRGIWKFEYFEE